MGGCYGICVAGSGVCREARDGACVRHAEELKVGRTEARERVASGTCTSGTDPTNCKADMCNVQIGGETYCLQCNAENDHLIDGACVTTGTQDAATICVSPTQGKCGSCGNGYFMYKGGCYNFAGELGSLICADPESGAAAGKAGVCTKCVAGFFKHPSPANNKQSCTACNETDTIDDVRGVLKCKVCNPPNDTGAATCTACADGTFVNNSGAECTSCNAACATCTSAETTACTSCKDSGNNQYFKEGDANDGTGTCVSEATCKDGIHFPTTDKTNQKKICTLCNDASNGGIADCQTCSKTGDTLKCLTCTTDTKKPNKAGSKCFDCQMAGCSHCSADGVCEACDNTNKVSPGGSSCVTNCPDSSSEQSGACICNSGFASSGDSCVASSRQPQHRYHSRISVAVIAACSVLLIICLPLQNEQS
ncbi:Variant-specific surface protein [Giardia duodenalis]|uniref:Variant-specific surface protein n=1 Tax=Giardia intestinalis TaxID=5741 RepID=V6TQD1_GIAIN|nr:Variant-specific surface protein [Giardia intestinalis]